MSKDKLVIKDGRVRVMQSYSGQYTIECRTCFFLPFWSYMGFTYHWSVVENHVKWIKENLL